MFRTILLAAILLLVSACGGGGGGGDDTPRVDIPIPTPGPAPVSYSDAAERTALSSPVFGESITQSARVSDTAATSFNPNSHFEVTVDRGGSSVTLSTNNPSSVVANEEASPVTGRRARIGTLVNGSVKAGVLVDWDSSDATDYLAGGYWVYESSAGSFEIGAFVDGPEFQEAPTIPASGEVTYTGVAGGTYVYGANTGEYIGDLTLLADFDPGYVEVGMNIRNIRLHNQGGSLATILGLGSFGLSLSYGSVPIQADGTFSGSGSLGSTYTGNAFQMIEPTDGHWGGRFSSENDSEGNPRAVAGTHGGSLALTLNNGKIPVSFVGAFYGATETFRNSNQGGGCVDCPPTGG